MRAAAAAAAGRMVVPRTMRGRKRPRGGRLSSSSSSGGDGGVEVHAPVGMGIERPTPLLLLQGEGRTAEWCVCSFVERYVCGCAPVSLLTRGPGMETDSFIRWHVCMTEKAAGGPPFPSLHSADARSGK